MHVLADDKPTKDQSNNVGMKETHVIIESVTYFSQKYYYCTKYL